MATIRAMPILEVREIARTMDFYKQLGFFGHRVWGDPPAFVIMQRGDVTIGFTVPDHAAPVHNEWWSAYIYVSDAAALHKEFTELGIEPTDPEPREYGLLDFDVIDPDGHRLAFGSDLSPAPIAPGLAENRGRG